jgi:hypothetical protein
MQPICPEKLAAVTGGIPNAMKVDPRNAASAIRLGSQAAFVDFIAKLHGR